ncbi:MAG: hydroxyacid dehydrogenase [Rhodospirillaceae bacterium]|jgi:phosphoglycerate dehydrogenase-like enzyme|nr:hydroxyacid dehydrogenase [Rhodospirillaceae bacterium]MBT5194355.1 hydroxyacid dehydrogenase [Rhodospirillaceae bacterium]MBT5897098.1 hydroxyacid dehydrogenase [Rhodospirillaceae bacterium]MBT6427588.1 hydroxyacid dehydrogenase [Rhodospirillaceae bacterium]
MVKPALLYYRLLNWQPENQALAADAFDVRALDNPDQDTDDILADIQACCAPLGFYFGSEKMDRCPNLNAIVTNTTGVPHIDMAAAAARNIAVFSLKDEQAFLDTITPTAEHTWGLLLALLRRTPWCFDHIKSGHWNRFDWGAPAMLSRLKLGIIGYGRLGRRVARYGAAFDMSVRYHDPFVASDGTTERVDNLVDLVAWADVISLHVPALPETQNMINAHVIGQFKPGSLFINTARAELVDEAALLTALRDGRIAGYGADVLDGEFDLDFKAGEHPLVRHAQNHDNVLLTPHIAGSTHDAWRETQGRVIDMARRHFEDWKP